MTADIGAIDAVGTLRVEDVYVIRTRGNVACGPWRGPTVEQADFKRMRRASDGAEWNVRGVERFTMFLGRPVNNGDELGLLLVGPQPLAVGDTLSITDAEQTKIDPDWRACGVCEERTIPRGVDWPFWFDGRCVHAKCLERALAKGDGDDVT